MYIDELQYDPILQLNVPWRALAPQLVELTRDGQRVLYRRDCELQLHADSDAADEARCVPLINEHTVNLNSVSADCTT